MNHENDIRQIFSDAMSLNEVLEPYLNQLYELVEDGHIAREGIEKVLSRISRAALPEDILRDLLSLATSPKGKEVFSTENALFAFVVLADQSPYASRALMRSPHDIIYLSSTLGDGKNWSLESLVEALNQGVEDAGERQPEIARWDLVWQQLRCFKRRESLRIFLGEVLGLTSMRQATAQIADLAQACVRVAVVEAARYLGDATLYDDFCVLGMGKLGARELNYSSDIDLIYICRDSRELSDARRVRLNDLARSITAALGESTVDGYVFRVDLRLRPEGAQGVLVHPSSAMLDYYLSWGRTWERSAMLKARAVGGNEALGKELLTALEPFLYRKYLDYGVLDDLRSMKLKIEQHARLSDVMGMEVDASPDELEEATISRRPTTPIHSGAQESPLKARLRKRLRSSGINRIGRNSVQVSPSLPTVDRQNEELTPSCRAGNDRTLTSALGWNVKIGAGGIREIEFFVQALQLVHCGVQPGLRVRNTLEALDRLLYAGLVTHEDHAILADGYDLFRRLEHRIQMENDHQAHRMPNTMAGLELLGKRLAVSDEELYDQVAYYRHGISERFSRLFDDAWQQPAKPTVRNKRPPELDLILGADDQQLQAESLNDALIRLGFHRPRQVAGQLRILRSKPYSPFAEHNRLWQQELAGFLIEASASAPDADQAFSHLSRLFTIVGDHPGYYRMLHENPHATRLLIHALGSSQLLASIIFRDPDSFERLVAVGSAVITRDYRSMEYELREYVEGVRDPDRRMGRIRNYQQQEILRIALHEIAGVCDIDQTTRQLSLLAECTINAVLGEVYTVLCRHIQSRVDADSLSFPPVSKLPFCVLAFGKLGGMEMGFGSDLDIVFVYELQADYPHMDHTFYTRLAQRLVRTLSAASEQGRLYEIDTRLRPSGSQGTLVVSSDSLAQYYASSADLWERQALIKARPLTGCWQLRGQLMVVRHRAVFKAALPADMNLMIDAVREQMQQAFINHRVGVDLASLFDVKMQRGATVDIEFMTQYIQLISGNDCSFDIDERISQSRQKGHYDVGDDLCSQSTLYALLAMVSVLDSNHPLRERLTVDAIQEMIASYLLLRRVEARLRLDDHRAPNHLPTDEEAMQILARRCGYQGSTAGALLRSELTHRVTRIYTLYKALFRSAFENKS